VVESSASCRALKRLLTGLALFLVLGFPLAAWTLSISVSTTTLAFGTRPANTWLDPQVTVIRNDFTDGEDLLARISPLTDGSNSWILSSTANGADSIRAQWSITSDSGPWIDVDTYDTDFPIASNLAPDDSISFWFRIQTPTATSSYDEHSATLTVTASLP
jgi:hypothetical protein